MRLRTRAVWVALLAALGSSAVLVAAPPALAATVPDAAVQVHTADEFGSLVVRWAAPPDGGSPITGYLVDLRDGSGELHRVTLGEGPEIRFNTPLGSAYRPCVYAVNAVGRSQDCGLSDSTVVLGLPTSPPDLDVTYRPDGAVRVSWTPADAYGPDVDRYTLTSSPSGRTATIDSRVWDARPPDPDGSGYYFVDLRGLRTGLDHTVSVTATNSVGTGEPASLEFGLESYDEITAGETLFPGEELRSASGRYSATMQEDGNVVVYADDARPVWDTHTYGRPGAQLDLQDDGNLVLYDVYGTALWSTGTWGRSGNRLTLQDDGNLVLYAADGAALWSSGWDLGPGAVRDTLWSTQQLTTDQSLTSRNGRYTLAMQYDGNLVVYAPGGRAVWDARTWRSGGRGVVMQADGNLVLYGERRQVLWNSLTWGNPGARLTLQDDGNLVLYSDRGAALWSSGWDLGPGAVRDTLWPTQQLVNGQSLTSRNGQYQVTMQTDGNVVVYAPGRRPLWNTNTYTDASAPSRLSLQTDGNLVLVASIRRPIWNSRTWGNAGTRLVMQDDGNLVVYAGNGRALWSSLFGRTY